MPTCLAGSSAARLLLAFHQVKEYLKRRMRECREAPHDTFVAAWAKIDFRPPRKLEIVIHFRPPSMLMFRYGWAR